MQGFFIALVYVIYVTLGLVTPFVMGLGYVWVDIFTPQNVAPDLLGGFPVATVIGIALIVVYIIGDRRNPPKIGLSMTLILLLAIWMTLTLMWAEVPDAESKWDWAFKVIAFAAFMPFVFRSRVQIEAVLLTIIFALSGTIVAIAAKTLIGGGGYGFRSTLVEGNSGIGESSTVAMLSVAILPLIGFIRRHSVIFPPRRHTALVCWGLSACCVVSSVGLFTRTGLGAVSVFFILTWLQSRRKLLLGVVIAAGIFVLIPLMGPAWEERMSTITNPTSESSAATRIAVWMWTLEYVSNHPLGGGFNVYEINSFALPMPDGSVVNQRGRAFHSIYFEILGELGIVGFAIWVLLISAFFLGMYRLRRQTRGREGAEWLGGLTTALMTSVTIYLAGGAFIGVGFQPILYYLIAVSIAAKEYWRWTMMGYYTEEEVCGLFKVGSETIRRWERDQGFPQRVDLSGHHRRRKGFLVEEVGAWDARRRNARRAVPHDDSPSE